MLRVGNTYTTRDIIIRCDRDADKLEVFGLESAGNTCYLAARELERLLLQVSQMETQAMHGLDEIKAMNKNTPDFDNFALTPEIAVRAIENTFKVEPPEGTFTFHARDEWRQQLLIGVFLTMFKIEEASFTNVMRGLQQQQAAVAETVQTSEPVSSKSEAPLAS